jgi:hypothetical protein
VVVNSAGVATLITPPQAHSHLLSTVASGISFAVKIADGGAQGSTITGTQGIGVNAPIAADVALATSGFAMLLHIPKGGMLSTGTMSKIVAASRLRSACPAFRRR